MDKLYEPIINMARHYTRATGAVVRVFDNQVYEIYPENPQSIGCANCVLHSKRQGDVSEEGFIKSCVLHSASRKEVSFVTPFYICHSGLIFWVVSLMFCQRPWLSLVACVRLPLTSKEVLRKKEDFSFYQRSLSFLDKEQKEWLFALREVLKLNIQALSEIYHEKVKQANFMLVVNQEKTKMTGTVDSQKKISGLVSSALVYMEENFHLPITLKHVAGHLGLSEAYFSKLFKRQLGKGFCEYLNGLRIQKAKELLLETYLSIDDISTRCGYTQQGYFTKIFKSYVGTLPRLYRKAQHSL